MKWYTHVILWNTSLLLSIYHLSFDFVRMIWLRLLGVKS